MPKYELSKNANENYVAQFVKIKEVNEIKGTDNLAFTNVQGNNVIVNKHEVKEGDVMIYFPVECQIADNWLHGHNLYRDKELNENKEKSGFFDRSGRVKCTKLRGHYSQGFVTNIKFCHFNPEDVNVGDKFDTVYDGVDGRPYHVVNKYVIKEEPVKGEKKKRTRVKTYSQRVLEEYFKFHYDTHKFGDHLNEFDSTTHITVSYKIHGTSGISSYTRIEPQAKWYDKVRELFLGKREPVYENIFASRTRIRNSDNGETDLGDIWKRANDRIKPFLKKDMTIYYEIAGYKSDNGLIQGGYDYGCAPGEFDIYVYRITTTTADGFIVEWPMNYVNTYITEKYVKGVKCVPIIYEGSVWDYIEAHNPDDTRLCASERLYEALYAEHCHEKYCHMCKTKVPAEGVVVRKNGMYDKAYKLKSALFLYGESKALDKGEIDTESQA